MRGRVETTEREAGRRYDSGVAAKLGNDVGANLGGPWFSCSAGTSTATFPRESRLFTTGCRLLRGLAFPAVSSSIRKAKESFTNPLLAVAVHKKNMDGSLHFKHTK